MIPRAEGEALEEEELGRAHHQPVRALVGEEGVDVSTESSVYQPGVQERGDRGLVAAPCVVRPARRSFPRRRGHVLLGQRAVLQVLCLLEVGPLVLFRAYYLLVTCYGSRSDVFWNFPRHKDRGGVEGEE